MNTRIQNLELHERPRERLESQGPAGLSDKELLAIMLGAGSKHRPVLRLAEAVLEVIDKQGAQLTAEVLSAVEGIGRAKALSLVAAMEFMRRRVGIVGTRIRGAEDVYPLLQAYWLKKQEYFLCISLNGAHELLAKRVISIGLLNRTLVHPREVFADALAERAAAIIVAHNHPSGTLSPSDEDMQVTKQLSAAGALLGVPLLDHIVFSSSGYYSFAAQGLL